MVELGSAIATVVERARQERGWSTQELADRSGVSRSMISKIEREAVQPTAVLLGRLSGALGLTLTELLGQAEAQDALLSRAGDPNRGDRAAARRAGPLSSGQLSVRRPPDPGS